MYLQQNLNHSCTYSSSNVSITSASDSWVNPCMIQLDGNITLSSDDSFVSSSDHSKCSSATDDLSEKSSPIVNTISVQIGNCHPPPFDQYESYKKTRVLKTFRRSNKAVQGLSLPSISNYNMRSFFQSLTPSPKTLRKEILDFRS